MNPGPRHRRRGVTTALAAAGTAALLLASGGPAEAQQPEPYRDPSFTCEVIDFGSDPPPIPGPANDPLCVRYDKTNATVSDLQALDFLAAEPGRVGLVALPPRCGYWQQDHWEVRLEPSLPPLVSWRGSYWYDASSAGGGAVLRDLRVAGVPVAADAFVDAVAPLIGPEQAAALRAFTDSGGGGGVSFRLPDGVGLGCRADTALSDPASQPVVSGAPSGPDSTAGGSAADVEVADKASLPATGGTAQTLLAATLTCSALLVLTALRRAEPTTARRGEVRVQSSRAPRLARASCIDASRSARTRRLS